MAYDLDYCTNTVFTHLYNSFWHMIWTTLLIFYYNLDHCKRETSFSVFPYIIIPVKFNHLFCMLFPVKIGSVRYCWYRLYFHSFLFQAKKFSGERRVHLAQNARRIFSGQGYVSAVQLWLNTDYRVKFNRQQPREK